MEMTCAILSGGKSRRMGRDKATIQVGSTTLIRQAYDVAKGVFSDIMVVSSLHSTIEGVAARIVRDLPAPSGSLTGIASALLNADTPYVFVLGCDMPFLTRAAIRYTMGEAHGEHIVIPQTQGGFEPMHAIYHRSCLSVMLSAIDRGNMKVSALFAFFCVKPLPPNPLFFNNGVSVFSNINTREELSRAERVLG